jgi:hypothetical protein
MKKKTAEEILVEINKLGGIRAAIDEIETAIDKSDGPKYDPWVKEYKKAAKLFKELERMCQEGFTPP